MKFDVPSSVNGLQPDRSGHRGPETYAPRHARDNSDRLGGSAGRFDIEQAAAQISARRGVLDAEQTASLLAPAFRPQPQHGADYMPGTPGADTGALSGIERALTEVREALHNLIPAGGLAGLNDAVASLTRKIDLVVVQSDPVSVQRLESSIAALRESFSRSPASEATTKLADDVRVLTRKVEEMTPGGGTGGSVAFGHLEDRIVKLMERLDASDSKFSHLEAIERGLADLLVHIEGLRADSGDRLRADRPTGAFGDAAPSISPAAAPNRTAMPGTMPAVIDPHLPPDQPIEPGSAQRTTADFGARIAASEAALGGIKPPAGAETSERSSFIAAARRAAQAAAQEQPTRPGTADARRKHGPSAGSKTAQRVKSLLIAGSVIAIVVGSFQVASKFLHFGKTATTHQRTIGKATGTKAPDEMKIGTGGAIPDPSAEPADAVLLSPAAPSSGNIAMAPALDLTNPQSIVDASPSKASPKAPNDITGSIPQPLVSSQPIVPAIPMPPAIVDHSGPSDGKLPAPIGGPRLRAAAAKGDPAAAYEVGIRYAEGRGVPANLQEAAHWFEKAASKGLAPAQFRLASLLEKGRGVPKDLARAKQLYLAAAAKGNAKAMHNLAVLYAEGADGKPDYAAAAQWFRKAANKGVSDSQYNLGILCARGLGTAINYADSYKWFALAAEKGDRESAKKRDEIATRLDPKTLAAAQHAVKTWTAEPQPAEATTVPHPAGGWDQEKTAAPAPRAKPRTAGPYEIGKR